MRGFILGLVLLVGVSLQAQTGVPTGYILRVHAPGASAAVTTLSITASQAQCNQARVAGTGTVNPTEWRWADIANTGRDCVYVDASRFTLLPDGNYEGTVQANGIDGSGGVSARVPFSRVRPNPPAAPTDVRII